VILNHQDDFKRGIDYIGVNCVFYCHDGNGRLLLQKRSEKCRDEVGHWDVGGGAMEFGETPEETVAREVAEEYGCDPLMITLGGVRTILRDNGGVKTHWVSFVFLVRVDPARVIIGDPEKMEEIGWFLPESFPSPLHSQTLLSFEVVKELFSSLTHD